MDSEVSSVDIIVLIILIGLVFLMAWVIKMIKQTDQSRVDSLCKKGITIPLKAGSIADKIPFIGAIPPNDTTIKLKLNC